MTAAGLSGIIQAALEPFSPRMNTGRRRASAD
jgi:hypothetical protein